MWSAAEVNEFIKTIGALCVPLAMAYAIIGAARSKRAETVSLRNAASLLAVSTDVARLEKNTNSISERNQAIAMKLGITEGIAQERASVLANAPGVADTSPLPVADAKTAEAVQGVVDAIKETSGFPKPSA